MRLTVVAAFLICAATAYSLGSLKPRSQRAKPPSLRADDIHEQRPILDISRPAMPPSTNPPSDHPAGGPGTVILSDVMGRDRSINIFAGLVRDVEGVSRRLDDEGQSSTVLAPLNSAMEKLPRKPWEDPEEYDKLGAEAYEGDEGWERAQRNIRRFVEAHVVPANPWKEGEKAKAMSGEGELWWESRDGAKVIQPGNIEVDSVASSVQNGQVWILKGVRNYSS